MRTTGVPDHKMKIYIDGNQIWDRADGNPLDFVPPIGSAINYQKFRQSETMPIGEKVRLIVDSIEFDTEEWWNGLYNCRVVKIHCILDMQSTPTHPHV